MLGGVEGRRTIGLIIDDQVDVTLSPEVNVLRTMPGDAWSSRCSRKPVPKSLLGGGELDEVEPAQTHGVVE